MLPKLEFRPFFRLLLPAPLQFSVYANSKNFMQPTELIHVVHLSHTGCAFIDVIHRSRY